jgi:outer membrane protein insertion porin family
MSRLPLLLLAVVLVPPSLQAQGETQPQCARPDTVIVRGNSRVTAATILGNAGLNASGDTLNFRIVQRAIKNVFATGQFSDVRLTCEVATSGRSELILTVAERPVLTTIDVKGTNVISTGTVRDKIDLPVGKPLDPAKVAQSAHRIDSLYAARGYYLAKISVDSAKTDEKVALTFDIDEGRKLAISGVDIVGNTNVSDKDVVGAMQIKPEGFWWWHKGAFDQDKFETDLGDRIPKLFQSKGFIDFQVAKDTLLVDRQRGKGLLQIHVKEGERYHVGHFEVVGNQHFSTEQIYQLFPFVERSPTITQRIKGLFGGGPQRYDIFDEARWEDATNKLRDAYANDGYIYAQINPVVERVQSSDSIPIVNLRWEISEGTVATINRINIVGNDYTSESCIRQQLVLLPGEVFNKNALIQSYQNIANLGFFDTPLPAPETQPVPNGTDVDITFKVKEKRTGNINFGASVGQGTGLGGFIGLDQPNLFGTCKHASVQWQYGRYINDFQLTYSDPSIKLSRVSGTVTAYHTMSRFIVADLGQDTRTGGSIQLGFPIRNSNYSRLYVSYGGETENYSGGIANNDSLAAALQCNNCFRSTLGTTVTHDTRQGIPFPFAGGMQTFSAQFNGGPLGGTASFQRYTTELHSYTTLASFGGGELGAKSMQLVLGLTARGGAVFGDAGPFFISQKFALGGTQYGEMLRGYDEFSITPQGYDPSAENNGQAKTSSFGNMFFTTTAELGVRFNQMLYTDLFFDAGNLWNSPSEFDPTRLFRGAGIGVEIVTPLGPLGLDWAYGFDRVDALGRPDPKWKLHFRLGNLF